MQITDNHPRDGPQLAQDLAEVYEVSTKCSYSPRVPFLGKWRRALPYRPRDFFGENEIGKDNGHGSASSESASPLFFSFKEVQEYLTFYFGRGSGTYPFYDSYDAHRLIAERFMCGGTIYTFRHFPAPDSIAARNGWEVEFYTHVRIRSRVLSKLRQKEEHLEDLF